MNKSTTYPFILIVVSQLCDLACTKIDESQNISSKTNSIVLIVDNPPINNRYTFENGPSTSNNGNYELVYIDDEEIIRHLPLTYKKRDTIVIKTERDFIEIQHAYKAIDNFNYIFNNGDTVLIEYDEKTPVLKIVNRLVKDFDINYEILKRQKICDGDFPATSKLFFMYPFYDFSFKNAKADFIRVGDLIKRDTEKELHAETLLLDSLRNDALLSDVSYKFYKTKMNINNYKVDLFNYWMKNSESDSTVFESILKETHDSLLYYSYVREELGLLSRIYFEPKVKRIVTSSSNLPDYKILYDTIMDNQFMSDNIKRVFMLSTMEDIIRHSSASEINSFIARYSKDSKDSSFVYFLKNKYNLDSEISNQLNLANILGHELTFEQLLRRNSGRLMYVDFWASWCAPCIRAFPEAENLKNEYKDEEITFIYLSIDEDVNQWKKASIKYHLDDSASSFIISNRYTSKFLEELSLAEIPRYLLLDKKGKLVHKNAPHPQGDEVRKLFNGYLIKD